MSQVADLFARPLDVIELTVLIMCLLFFWIIPLHLGARILLDARRGGQGTLSDPPSKLDLWLPRDLGFLAILALVIAIQTQLSDFAILGGYFESKRLHAPSGTLWVVPVITFLLYLVYLGIRGRTNVTMSAASGRRLSRLFALASLVLVFIASMAPFTMADLLGGLLFLPMLVGGWIMPLVALMVLAKRSRFWRRFVQLGTVAVITAMVLANATPSNPFHDIRLLPDNASKPQTSAQLTLEAYIAQWKKLNNCAAEEASGRRCKAILVTAEGGASRAAFQVATVMGQLLDEPPVEGFREKLFLFSGVSGGSLGLATTRQAMADSVNGKPPCREDFGRAGRHWIYYGTDHAKEVTTSWRKCLQLLVSADYLTPAAVGLALRDWWMALPAMLDLGFDDRSALLERSMERHYAAITGKDCEKFEGLCSAFGHTDRSASWLPGLILNSTLVERGQTVVVSDIDPSSSFPGENACRSSVQRVYPAHLVYSDAMPMSYDVYELLDARTRNQKPDPGPTKIVRDISMSTAIVASARFPLISSRGNVRDTKGILVGQLVDGGYFDNSGLANILDIIDALNCNKVDSVVVNIRNNPLDENAHRLWIFAGRENIRQPSLEISGQKINVSLSPVQAFLNSSEGHILENRFATINRVGYNNYIFSNVYKAICVGTATPHGDCIDGRVQLDSVSMSWWLSSNVQLFIEMQDNDKLLDVDCSETHCRDRPSKMLAEAFKPAAQPQIKVNETLDPGRMGLDNVNDLKRLAK
ncbi:hypothetical protein IHQ71_20185 [Rhizobium sp. TH2]|uniref:hypothetical protein n=1 Tax=Rhizobium sp. TH2 TaxID=2775403 RepID=UPI00215899CE|nr:hypothetical protein [Rhizobium sp. TH2]UVC07507.1 hypothetical protein IHQ71_20185 [Rhizobium sp. TH2]